MVLHTRGRVGSRRFFEGAFRIRRVYGTLFVYTCPPHYSRATGKVWLWFLKTFASNLCNLHSLFVDCWLDKISPHLVSGADIVIGDLILAVMLLLF